MNENEVIVLQSDLDMLTNNIVELSSQIAELHDQLRKQANYNANWVMKFHEVKAENSKMKRALRELQK